MTSIIKRRVKKYGLPPGALVHTGTTKGEKIRLTLIDYDQDTLKIRDNVTLDECLDSMIKPNPTWINISGIHDIQMIEKIGRRLGLHPLLLEDILNSGQRSKVDDYKDTLYIVFRQLKWEEGLTEIDDQQISIVLGNNYLITFMESESDIFKPILERLKVKNSRMRTRGSDYLAYSLADCLVDHYFITLEKMDNRIEYLEETLVDNPSSNKLREIQHLKRQISQLRKAIWPTREVISKLIRMDTLLIREANKIYLQDVYDHVIQAIDTIENFRDIAAGMVELYISNINFKMNEVMKILTVVATIFVPLTFITSLYGMNFKHMPELEWEWGYYYLLGIMAIISFSMWRFFKRKEWV